MAALIGLAVAIVIVGIIIGLLVGRRLGRRALAQRLIALGSRLGVGPPIDETSIENRLEKRKYLLEYFSTDFDSILIRNGGLNVPGVLEIYSLKLILVDKKINKEVL